MIIKANSMTWLVFYLQDTNGNPVLGVPYTGVTVRYIKNGWLIGTKIMTVDNWMELGYGYYAVLFNTEYDMVGSFVSEVSGSGFVTVRREDQVEGYTLSEIAELIKSVET